VPDDVSAAGAGEFPQIAALNEDPNLGIFLTVELEKKASRKDIP
jgi:hypothetical protein